MDIDRNKIYAVISGDIIGSSKLPPSQRAELLNIMKQASNELRTFLAQSVPLSVDIYAGDSWQLLVTEPGDALRAALYYRASIIAATEKKVDTRLVIALGRIDFVPGERVSEGDGEAFRLSGRTLNDSANKQQLRFVADGMDDSDLWDATFGLFDVVVQRWTAKHAQVICGALKGWSHAEIAAHCTPPVARASVTRSLDSANWHVVEQLIKVFSSRLDTSKG